MASTTRDGNRFGQEADRLISEAQAIADDYSSEVRRAVDLAAAERLDDETTRVLFTRIVSMLRGYRDAGEAPAAVVAEIKHHVERILAERRTTEPAAEPIVLQERNGLRPRKVIPVPTFNGQPVDLTEGYVDVTTLRLWRDNERVKLYVQEFKTRNKDREPDAEELLELMHGKLALGMQFPGVTNAKDPFEIVKLARSIARKGVERPAIVTATGEAKDGNRRIAASVYVMQNKEFTAEERERARWTRVWMASPDTTESQFNAVVVAMNFEDENKEPWPEYLKARIVSEKYHFLRDGFKGSLSAAREKDLRMEVAKTYSIELSHVERYLKMVQWADEFEAYHIAEGSDPAEVRYRANKIFQWFYEIQAGRGQDKLINALGRDEKLAGVVYDLMYDVLDSGLQVRNLHKVIKDEAALAFLLQAHAERASGHKDVALNLVENAIAEAEKNAPTKRLGFEMFLKNAVDRFDSTPPEDWRTIPTDLLMSLRRVLPATIGAVEGQLTDRGAV